MVLQNRIVRATIPNSRWPRVVVVVDEEAGVDEAVEGVYRKRYLRTPRNPSGGANLLLEARPSCEGIPRKNLGRKVRVPPQRRRVRMVSWKGRSVVRLG